MTVSEGFRVRMTKGKSKKRRYALGCPLPLTPSRQVEDSSREGEINPSPLKGEGRACPELAEG